MQDHKRDKTKYTFSDKPVFGEGESTPFYALFTVLSDRY